MKRLLLGLLLVSCGSDGDSERPVDASIDATPKTLVVTSTAFVEGGEIPVMYGCGSSPSPPLAWSGSPIGTQSYALVVLDIEGNTQNWVIYDIPAATTSLPEGVERAYEPTNVASAHQTEAGSIFGYIPPCPPRILTGHHHQFTLTALDVANLPGASATTTPADAIAAIESHKLAYGTLTATLSIR